MSGAADAVLGQPLLWLVVTLLAYRLGLWLRERTGSGKWSTQHLRHVMDSQQPQPRRITQSVLSTLTRCQNTLANRLFFTGPRCTNFQLIPFESLTHTDRA